MTKYVLLRPEGGLNDILCRIEVCARYALATGRILLIDTLTTGFGESFANYFRSIEPKIRLVESVDDIKLLSHLRVYPEPCAGLVGYRAFYKEGENYCERETEIPLQFDLTKNYQDDLLLYHGCGGGSWGHLALRHFQMTSVMKLRVSEALEKMPRPYAAVHLRATDLQTDYMTHLRQIKLELSGKNVYVATDSRSALFAAIQELNTSLVHNFATNLSEDAKPIHMLNELDEKTWNRSEINSQTIVDLMMLANAEKFYYAVTKQNAVSGFSVLALHLQNIETEKRTEIRTT
jgi:hypothetical protein